MREHSGSRLALAVVASFTVACASSGPPDEGGDEDEKQQQATCGDGVCSASEVSFCTQDCGQGGNNVGPICGNGTCESGEDNASCASDCPAPNTGGNTGTTGNCDALACTVCLLDQASCSSLGVDFNTCLTCEYCDGGSPDGVCDPNTEDALVCPSDC